MLLKTKNKFSDFVTILLISYPCTVQSLAGILTINKSVAKDNAVWKIGVILEINVSNGKKIDHPSFKWRKKKLLKCSWRTDKNLDNFSLQLQELGKNQKTKENQSGKDERSGTRAGTRSGTRSQTRGTTREMHSRDALWLPDICQTTTGRTYYQLFPPKPRPLHQWRDLKNRIRHDYNLVPLPYKDEDVVKR